MKLYVVAKRLPSREECTAWELQGVFSSIELAVSACRDRNHFYLELELNQELSQETVPMLVTFPMDFLKVYL